MLTLRADNLNRDTVAHGFFGRTGGVSRGLYSSLNCGVSRLAGEKDHRANVAENRRRVAAELGVAQLVTLSQVHSPNVVTVTEPWAFGSSPQGDAMVSATPGIALGVLTADCAPILFADAAAKVIGAAHAGWKGALTGVIAATLEAMAALGARRGQIAAAIGPCISQPNYEVGPEFRARFADADAGNGRYFVPSDRALHHRFDLAAYAADRLRQAGVVRIERLDACTYARADDFFSFRRATHRGEPDYGREISAIALL